MTEKPNLISSFLRRRQVKREIADWQANPPKGSTWHQRLNNFHCYFPCERFKEGSYHAWLVSLSDALDVQNGEFFRQESKNKNSLNSSLYMSQTPREFLNSINTAISKNPNIDITNINRLIMLYYQTNDIQESMRYLRELYDYLLPVYIELRAMGYSHYDLTG